MTRYARRCSAARLRNLQANHRYAVLVCFLWQTYQDTIDYIVDTHDKIITGVYKRAQTEMDEETKQRRRLIRTFLMSFRSLGKVVLDKSVDDSDLRQVLFSHVNEEIMATQVADAFYQFVTQEVIPLVEAAYPIDPADRTFMGHSWGGVFGLYSLFRDPLLYKNYLICSPDLPYGDGILFNYEEAYAKTHDSLSAKLFISQGGRETAEDNQRFVSVLEGRGYNDLSITHKSIMECEHCASPMPSFVAGLKAVFD